MHLAGVMVERERSCILFELMRRYQGHGPYLMGYYFIEYKINENEPNRDIAITSSTKIKLAGWNT